MIWRWPSQNTFGLWTVLCWTRSSRTQVGVSIYVWRLAGTLWTLLVTLSIVLTSCTEIFWSPCIYIFVYMGLQVKYRYSWPSLMNLNFLDRFSKNALISIIMKIRSGSRFVPYEQTDVMKLIVAFSNFAKAHENKSCVRSFPSQLKLFCK
jgi:hypothetical protein